MTKPEYTGLYVFAALAIFGGVMQCAGAIGLAVYLLAQNAAPMLFLIPLILFEAGAGGILSGLLIYCFRDIARNTANLNRLGQ